MVRSCLLDWSEERIEAQKSSEIEINKTYNQSGLALGIKEMYRDKKRLYALSAVRGKRVF